MSGERQAPFGTSGAVGTELQDYAAGAPAAGPSSRSCGRVAELQPLPPLLNQTSSQYQKPDYQVGAGALRVKTGAGDQGHPPVTLTKHLQVSSGSER